MSLSNRKHIVLALGIVSSSSLAQNEDEGDGAQYRNLRDSFVYCALLNDDRIYDSKVVSTEFIKGIF